MLTYYVHERSNTLAKQFLTTLAHLQRFLSHYSHYSYDDFLLKT